MKKECWFASLAMLLLGLASAVAQTPPDAGSLRQEMEKKREPVEPAKAAPTTSSDDTSAPTPAAGPSVTVTSFHFTGNTLLDEKDLHAAVSGFVKRPLAFSDLQKAAVAVADSYRQAGWIVRTYLPLQEINNGVVTITIVEGVFGETHLEGNPRRISSERLLSTIAAQQKQGAALSAAGLDRALLLINDLPGVAVSAQLAAGAKERQTDLMLKVENDPLLTEDVTVDNSGSRFTGEERLIATVSANSPFHSGDRFSTTLLYAQGIGYLDLIGTVPIGYSGLRAGSHVSYLKYDLIADEFSSLKAQGTSTALGLDASYPLIRARSKNLSLSFSYDTARFNNESNDVITTRYKVTTFEASLNGHRFDNLGRGGVTSAALMLVSGKVDLSDSPNRFADAVTTKLDGGFSKVRYFASREQHLSDRVSLHAALTGQLANGNLDSSQKIYLGGASGVRAYPANEAGGDQGFIVNVEGRVRLPRNFSVAGFYDRGQVTVNRDNDFLGAATLNSYSLQGVGLSVGWISDFGLSLKVTGAHRIGDNPRATANGNDQDGSLKKTRFWLQASMSF